MPSVVTKIMHKKFLIFGLVAGIIYVCQFICCVSACNFYSDVTRNSACDFGDGVIKTKEDATAIMDYAILLVAIYHIIEWVRATILLACILLGENFMQVYYATSISALYGFGCFIYLITVYFGDAKKCEALQKTRYQWLMVEVIYFFALFIPFQLPFIFVRCYKRESLEGFLNDDDDDDGEDDKEKEEEEKKKQAKERHEAQMRQAQAKTA